MATLSELIKKELGIEKAKISEEEKAKGVKIVGNLSMEQVVKVARMKAGELLAKDLKSAVKMVLGTVVSMPVAVEGKSAKDVIKEVDEGRWEHLLKS